MVDRDGPNASHQSSHQDDPYRRIELITGRLQRRSWTPAEKAAIILESLEPGSRVTEVARRHQITRGLLWSWRRQAMDAADGTGEAQFIPLRLAAEAESSAEATPANGVTPHDPGEQPPAGSIEIELGRARIRVQGVVDPQALRQVLTMIGRAS